MDFLADLVKFLWASVANLVALLSGVVGLVIDLIRRRYGWEVPNTWYVWIVMFCLMMGMFSAWRDEHLTVAQKQQKMEKRESEIEELRKRAELAARLMIESDREFYDVASPVASRFARIKVTNIGDKYVANVKVVVTRINERGDWSLQLPLSSSDIFSNSADPPVVAASANLSSGGEQYFDAIIECSGTLGTCPGGQLAFPYVKSERHSFAAPFKIGSYSGPDEFTVRASGEGVSAVVKTFTISVGSEGKLLLNPKSDR